MTGPAIQKPDPLAFLYKNLPEGTKALDPQKPDPLAFLYDKKKVGDQPGSDQVGFLDYVGSVSKSWFKMAAVSARLHPNDPGKDPQFTDPDMIKIRNAIRQGQATGSGADIAAHDLNFVNFFGKFMENGKEQIEKIASAPGAAAEEFKQHPIDFMGQLGKSFVTPIVDFAELTSGVSLTGDDIHALTPEEKAERIKSVVATGAMLATGIGMSKLLPTTEKVIDAATNTSRLVAKGTLAQRLMKSTAVAGASGAAYSLTRYANEADQLSETIINGVMFAPLGIAHELLFGETPKSKKISPAQEGAKVSQTRQVSDVLGKSFQGITQQIDAFTHANDVAEAVLTGKLYTLPSQNVIIRGVDPSRLSEMSNKVPENFRSVIHMNKDGTADLLVHDGTVEDEKLFEKHGYVKNQIVSYNGGEYKIFSAELGARDLNNIQIVNRHDASEIIEVPKSALRDLTNTTFDSKQATDQLFNEWRTSTIQPKSSPLDALQEERSQIVKLPKSDPSRAARLTTVEGQIERLADKTRNDSPIGFDETPSENMLDNVPSMDVSKHISAFLESKGFTGDTRAALERNFHDRLFQDVYANHMTDAERMMVDAARKAKAEYNAKIQSERLTGFNKLARLARSNDYEISDGGSGRVIVRDLKHHILGAFNSNEDAATFIGKSGQARGINLDQPNSISGSAASGGIGAPPASAPFMSNDLPFRYVDTHPDWSILRALDNSTLITRNRPWMLNVDGMHETKLYDRVMTATQTNRNVRDNQMKPFVEKKEAIRKFIGKMPEAEREMMLRRIETMSPQEVFSSFLPRPMTSLEQSLGKGLHESGVDIENVFRYNRELEKLDEEFPIESRQDPKKAQEYNVHVLRAREAWKIDANHEAKASLLRNIETMNKADTDLDAIVRYARSLSNGPDGGLELTRSQFDNYHKLSGKQIAASMQISKLLSELGDEFGVPMERRLGNYMTHARLFTDGTTPALLKYFSKRKNVPDAYFKMARTGELSPFEMDPLRAIDRYMKAGFDVKSGFSQAVENARVALNEEARRIPDGKLSDKVIQVGTQYLNDVRGWPEASDKFAQGQVDAYIAAYGLDKHGVDINVRRDWVNGSTALISTASLAARPVYGAAHFAASLVLSLADRDPLYTARMLKAGSHVLRHPEVLDEVRAQGALSTISPITGYTSEEFGERVSKGLGAISRVGFKLSGLPTAYEMFAGGHYLTTKADALSAITKYGRKEISWRQVKDELWLDKHYAPVAQKFQTLVHDGKSEEAASFLAGETVQDLVGRFGNANHPSKWGTNVGRIVGQFGQWHSWLGSTVTRGASRGTVAQRVRFVATLAATSWLAAKAEEATGINTHLFNLIKEVNPFSWAGGPLVSIFNDVHNAYYGYGYEQKAAHRRLAKMLPVAQDAHGNLHPQLNQNYIPFSNAVTGILHGIEAAQQGNSVKGAFELAGFRRATPKQ